MYIYMHVLYMSANILASMCIHVHVLYTCTDIHMSFHLLQFLLKDILNYAAHPEDEKLVIVYKCMYICDYGYIDV